MGWQKAKSGLLIWTTSCTIEAMVVAILITIFLLYFTLAIHEFGHYLLLKRYGIPISIVAFGGPPWVLRFRYEETEFRFGLLFLYAYVKPKEEGEVYDTRLPLPPIQAVAVFLAGPLMNVLTALFGGVGILLIDGVKALDRLHAVLFKVPTLMLLETWKLLTFQSEVGKVGIITSIGHISEAISGGGIATFLSILVVLNVAVAFFNLLPIPPLDGGQALMQVLPRSPWLKRIEVGATFVGVGIILALTLASFGYDLLNLLR